MYLLLAGLFLCYEGISQLLEGDVRDDRDRKIGWLEHNQNALAKGQPPAELERRMRELAQEELAKRPAK